MSRKKAGMQAIEALVQIEETLFGQEITGAASWLVQQGWSQVRTETGQLFQTGAFGPLPGAQEGTSRVFEDRLCDRWRWQGEELENCQLVLRLDGPGRYALQGETGVFEFALID